MRAVFIEERGSIDHVQVGSRPDPQPGPGQVCLRVRAAALNHLDLWVIQGGRAGFPQEPQILGSDAAGVVEELGSAVSGLAVGDEVVVNPGVSSLSGEWALRGQQSEEPGFAILGAQLPGTCAERVVVPAVNVQPKPGQLSWEEAAALPLAHLTAWHMLFDRGRLQAGETCLIHGIGGGVALAALQLVQLAGGQALVTSSSEEKLERARQLGAAQGINYRQVSDVAAAVRELTGGRGVDLCVDTVGAATLPASLASLRRGGRVVCCGATSGVDGAVDLRQLYWNHLSLLGSTMGSAEDFRRLLRAVSFTGMRPVVDRVMPLEEYPEAIRRMAQGAQFGKLVLRVA